MTAAMLGRAARYTGLVWLLVGAVVATAQPMPGATPTPTPTQAAASAASAAEPASAAASSAASSAATAAAPARAYRRVPARWRVEIEAPGELRELLLKYLDVMRFRGDGAVAAKSNAQAEGGVAAIDRSSITLGELRRLVAATPDQARQLLATEGYFSAQVQAQLSAAATPEDEFVVHVTVQPGPQTQVAAVTLLFQGELDRRAEQNEPAAQALVRQLEADWSLPRGEAFTQARWSSAKSGVLTTLRAQGYLASSWSGTSASIDQPTHQASLFLVADSGPLYHFGPLVVDGLVHIKPAVVENLRDFGEGSPYTDKQLFDFQERLQKSGLFSSVAVAIDPDPAHAAAAPVTVHLKEQSMQQSTFGIGYSANTGARISLEQISRQVFDWDWQAKTVIELGSQQSTFKTDFTSHPLPGMRRNLVSAAIEHLEAAGATTHSQSFKIGRSRDEERIDRTVYAEWQHARVVGSDGHSTEASALTGNVLWVWRNLDSVLAPTRGYATSIEVALGESFATDQSNGLFGRVLWRSLAYLPLPDSWYASGRLDLGRVQSKPGVGIPDPLLFRAGGDNSIRGYDYRSIGPTRDGVPVGARTLGTGSIELAHPLSARRPAWLWAVFADAGDAVDDLSNIQLKLGYGVGLRWRSPVGALRVDLAYGQHEHQLRLHLSLGMAF